MFGIKFVSKISAILLVLSFSSITAAEPYKVTFNDTIETTAGSYMALGAFTIEIVLDNGGSTAASQTWTSDDIVSITFNLNNAPDTITTVVSPVVLSTANGSFVTDVGGVLTTVPTNWSDNFGGSTISSTNDPGLVDLNFYINAGNDVYYNETLGTSADMVNVANNTIASFWTNPAAAPGPDPGPGPAASIPTLSQWVMVLLTLMLLVIGLGNIRRFS